jgi:hypothetical protein
MGPCEKAGKDYEERKRMRKLAGIQEEKKGIDPEFKAKVDKLADGIIKLTDELKRRRKSK